MVHIFLKCYKLQTIRWTLTCLIYTHGIDADLAFLHSSLSATLRISIYLFLLIFYCIYLLIILYHSFHHTLI